MLLNDPQTEFMILALPSITSIYVHSALLVSSSNALENIINPTQ